MKSHPVTSSPKKGNGTVNTPVCGACGTDEAVELITFTHKDTRELKRHRHNFIPPPEQQPLFQEGD